MRIDTILTCPSHKPLPSPTFDKVKWRSITRHFLVMSFLSLVQTESQMPVEGCAGVKAECIRAADYLERRQTHPFAVVLKELRESLCFHRQFNWAQAHLSLL